tara:strand:- start:893 stop:1084 length:192 start_codon:yes stop_codon:yes gene_type:complete
MIEKEDIINLVVALSKEDEWVRKQIAILLLSTTLNSAAASETAGFIMGLVDEENMTGSAKKPH